MKEYFENAYEGFTGFIEDIVHDLILLAKGCGIVLIYLTIPIWYGFYAIWKKYKNGDEAERAE